MNKDCDLCHGRGEYLYDEHHVKPCEKCCAHKGGWFKLEKHYGKDNGKWCCKDGCGTVRKYGRSKHTKK